MPCSKYEERRAGVCAYPCISIVELKLLTFLQTIALQRFVPPGLGCPKERKHYSTNRRACARRFSKSKEKKIEVPAQIRSPATAVAAPIRFFRAEAKPYHPATTRTTTARVAAISSN